MTVVHVVLGPAAETLPVAAIPVRANSAALALASSGDGRPSDSALARLVRGAVLCNDASFEAATAPGAEPRIVGGNGTDKALLAWALSLGGAEERHGWLAVLGVPFSSVTKQARGGRGEGRYL